VLWFVAPLVFRWLKQKFDLQKQMNSKQQLDKTLNNIPDSGFPVSVKDDQVMVKQAIENE